MFCYLCFTKSCEGRGDIAFTSAEAELLDVKKIIEKHFWLQINNAPETAGLICTTCWDNLRAFHQFYLSVERAHKAQTKATRSVLVKGNELDDAEVNHETSSLIKEKDESKATTPPQVKRKRGRPRKKELKKLPYGDNNDQSTALLEIVLEEINLNEIKVELPEADLTMTDVLDNSMNSDDSKNHTDQSEDDSDSDENNDADKDYKPIVEKVKPEPGKLTRKVRGKYKKHDPKLKKLEPTEKSIKFKENKEYIAENFKLNCNLCNEQNFEDFTKLLKHFQLTHNIPGYAVCCGKKFHKSSYLVDHLYYHKNPEIFKCHICGQIMSKRRSLQLHLRIHDSKSKGRIYKCEICLKSYYSQVIFQRHQQTHVPEEERNILCTQCDKRFSTTYIMQQHFERVHLNKYSQICEICGKSIIGREALTRHMEEHEKGGRLLIQCDVCGVSLTTKHGLVRHKKMMHTDECRRPMKCPICMKISPNANANKAHMQYMHSGCVHKCPMCEKTFKRPLNLREHMTTHTGDVLYTCPHCPKTFNSAANMHSHRKKIHPKEFEEARLQRFQAPVVGKERCTIKELSVRKTAAKILSPHPYKTMNEGVFVVMNE